MDPKEALRQKYPTATDQQLDEALASISNQLTNAGHQVDPNSLGEFISRFEEPGPGGAQSFPVPDAGTMQAQSMQPPATPAPRASAPVAPAAPPSDPYKDALSTMPAANEKYKNALADIKKRRRTDDMSVALLSPFAANIRTDVDSKWAKEEAAAKDETIGAAERNLKALKDVSDAKRSATGSSVSAAQAAALVGPAADAYREVVKQRWTALGRQWDPAWDRVEGTALLELGKASQADVTESGKNSRQGQAITSREGIAENTEAGRNARHADTIEIQEKLFGLKQKVANRTARTERRMRNEAIDALEAVVETASTLSTDKRWDSATGVSGRIGSIANKQIGVTTDRSTLDNDLDTLKSLLFMQALATLKALGQGSSGLGSLSDQEGGKLDSAYGKIDLSKVAPEQGRQILKKMVEDIKESIRKLEEYQEEDAGEGAGESAGGPSIKPTIVPGQDGVGMVVDFNDLP